MSETTRQTPTRRYFVVRRANPEGSPYVRTVEALGASKVRIGDSAPFPDSMTALFVRVSDLDPLPDMWWVGAFITVKAPVLELFAHLNVTHFDSRPVIIESTLGSQDSRSMTVVKILSRVPALDRARSRVAIDKNYGHIKAISKLVLDYDCIRPDQHLFRLLEYPLLLATDRFQEEWECRQLTGVRFQSTDDYTTRLA